MDERIIRAAIFIATASLSSTLTAYYVKAKIEEETRLQIQEVKDFYKAANEVHLTDIDPEEAVYFREHPVEVDPPDREDTAQEYRKHVELYGGGMKEDPESPQKPLGNHGEPIYLIPKEEYYSDEDNFEKESLTYFAGDKTLMNFEGEVIREPSEVVGEDFYDAFVEDGQTRSVWVRNERHQTDYEIDLDDGSHFESILGIVSEEDD